MFDALYCYDVRNQRVLNGLDYIGPDTFKHCEWYTVARISSGEGDGQDVEIQECRMPARFYRLIAHPTPNSVGEMSRGFTLSTGSGDEVGELLVALSKQVAQGMISVD